MPSLKKSSKHIKRRLRRTKTRRNRRRRTQRTKTNQTRKRRRGGGPAISTLDKSQDDVAVILITTHGSIIPTVTKKDGVEYLERHSGKTSNTNKTYAHLDLKPENICINKNGDVQLIDFDFAEIIGEDEAYNLDAETIYFITHLLNQNNLKKIRNEILISALPQRS